MRINLTDEQREDYLVQSDSFSFSTQLKHLTQIKGWNRGCLHALMATAGAGKSTYVLTVLEDFLRTNHDSKVFVLLSEVSVESFKRALAKLPHEVTNRCIYAVSEVDGECKDIEELGDLILSTDCDLFIYDNLTTSDIYSETFDQQVSVTRRLKELCLISKAAFLLIIHTRSDINEGFKGIIDINHVHGCKQITKLAEYFFVLQNINIGNLKNTTLRVCKHRDHNVTEKLFLLPFNYEKRIYDQDVPVDFDRFNELFKRRNKLGD